MPLTQTTKVERLRYMTEPLPQDVLVAGPISLTLYAAIDTTDTNWIIILKDVGPDVSVRTAREGERDVPSDLKERELWCSGKRYTSGLIRGGKNILFRQFDPDGFLRAIEKQQITDVMLVPVMINMLWPVPDS